MFYHTMNFNNDKDGWQNNSSCISLVYHSGLFHKQEYYRDYLYIESQEDDTPDAERIK